ncbi:amidase [Flexivirga lutea]
MEVMTELARRLGVPATGRQDRWQERAAQDETTIEQVRAARAAPGVAPCVRPGRDHWAPARSADAGAPSWSTPGGEKVAERVEQALARIEQQHELHAFTAVFAQRAREQAAELDRRTARGEPRGPLHGALLAVKDLVAVRGERMSGGTDAFRAEVATADAEVVQRLTRAGAVLVGATNLHPLAFGPFSAGPGLVDVVNPLCPSVVAGGSSGGSAAAVASGAVDMALGTDTAGSIRIPGAACGVVGLKGTFGAAPTGGVYPLASSLDHVGPLTGSVTDAALAWSVMIGAPSADVRRPESLTGLIVGEPSAFVRRYLDPPVLTALDRALSCVADLGARVQTIEAPTLELAPALMLCTIGPEALDVHLHLLRDRADELPDDVRLRLEAAMLVTGADYARAQRLRRQLTAELNAALGSVDVLLSPTLPITPPSLDGLDGMTAGGWPARSAMSRLTAPFNLTGQPALTLPWGRDQVGGGIGIQLAGACGDERTVLSVALALEAEADPSARW